MIYQNYSIGGELYHHGILGQRKGKRNGPPYPLSRSDHSASEKKAGWMKSLSGKISERKKKKKQAATLEKARATKAANAEKKRLEEEHEANKQKTLQSGSASEVMKYKGELTNEELNRVLNRLRYEKELGELSAKSVVTATDKIDKIVNNIDKARGWVEKGSSAYNAVAKVLNAFNDDGELPIIGQSKSDREAKTLKNQMTKLAKENQDLKNKEQNLKNKDQKILNKRDKMVNKTLKKTIEEKGLSDEVLDLILSSSNNSNKKKDKKKDKNSK